MATHANTKKSKTTKHRASSRTATSDDAEGGERGERGIWSGAISFGLVQIPVTMQVAEQAHELSFHQLDRRDMSRIGYEKINKTTGKEVPRSEIVKGYEITKGNYVLVEDADFENANVDASHTIDIQDFVDVRTIPPTYFERPYYLMPERGNKAYAVLRDVLERKGYAAIALVVIRTRQHLCAVVPQGEGLVLELLRFGHELREMSQPAKVSATVTPKELALAEQLVEGMTATWDPAKYRDTYRDDLLAALREKAKTGHVAPVHDEKRRAGSASVTDLVALLQKSVASTKRRERHAA